MRKLDPVCRKLWCELGVPDSYGTEPVLPFYAEREQVVNIGPNIVGRDQSLEPVAADAWDSMRRAAAEDGVELLMVSGFRSYEYQAGLIRRKLENGESIGNILRVNVAPGYSQHHTGRAIDIATPGSRPLLEEFEKTKAFQWLVSRAGAFGFVLSYPRDNSDGLIYEPWHWFLA